MGQPPADRLSGVSERLCPAFHGYVSARPAAHGRGPEHHLQPDQPHGERFSAALCPVHADLGPAQRQIRPQAGAAHRRRVLRPVQRGYRPGRFHRPAAVLARPPGREQRRHQFHVPGRGQGHSAGFGHGKGGHLDSDRDHPGPHAGPCGGRRPAVAHRLARHLLVSGLLRASGPGRRPGPAGNQGQGHAGLRLQCPGADFRGSAHAGLRCAPGC